MTGEDLAMALDILLFVATAGLTIALVYSRLNARALEQSYKLKLAARTKLVRAAAHELKQPLNAIAGLVGSLRQNSELAKHVREDVANRLERSVEDLADSLIDTHEIFELSTDGLLLSMEPLEVRTEVKLLVRKINRQLQERGHRVEVVCGALPEVWVEADKARLRQCLKTLLWQAAEQSHDGQVRFAYQVEKMKAAQRRISFIVRDNGPGMDQHRAKHFFDPSAYDQNPALRGRPSAMLALNLCAGLAEMMGGTISARSALGSGTAFEFVLNAESCPPLEAADHPIAQAPYGQGATPSFDQLSVLLVDDNEVNLFVLQEFVLPLGFGKVVCASGGAEAVERATEDDFDLVLLDLAMPCVDGFEAARLIRRGRRNSAVPILAVSAEFMKGGDSRLIAAGIDGFVPKPVVYADLLAAILKVAPQMVDAARARGVYVEEAGDSPLPLSA